MWLSMLLAIAYGGLLVYLGTLTGINALDGIIGVLLGLYICAHPAAHMLNLLYLPRGARQQLLSSESGMWWLAINILVLLVGFVTIMIGANRFVQPAIDGGSDMEDTRTTIDLDALAAFPALLKGQVQGLSDDALRFRPSPGEWSIVEIIGHITDVEAVWPGRIRQMLATDNPALARVDNDWVRQRDYQNKQVPALLQTLAERRAEFVELMRPLRAAQLARTGVHPTRGPLTVAGASAALADHDRQHLAQIVANIEAYRSKG
jgi:uncharacterized damage-inducible protein DinB